MESVKRQIKQKERERELLNLLRSCKDLQKMAASEPGRQLILLAIGENKRKGA